MAVDPAPQPFLGVVKVECGQTLQANHLVKLGERTLIAFSRAEVIASRKGVLGVKTKLQAVAVPDAHQDVAHVRKAIAQTRPLPGGDFERDAGPKTSARRVHRINGAGNVRYADLFARAYVGAWMRHQGRNLERFATLHLIDKGVQRFFP